MKEKVTIEELLGMISGLSKRLSSLEKNPTGLNADNLTYALPCPIGTVIYKVRNIGYMYPDHNIVATRYDKTHISQNVGSDFFLTFEEAERILKGISKK